MLKNFVQPKLLGANALAETTRSTSDVLSPPATNPMNHIISLGAGVQSSTLALLAAHGKITPMPTCAIFADTQDEPLAVYEWLEYLKPLLPFPTHTVTKGKLSEMASRVRLSKKSGLNYMKPALPMFTLSPDGKRGMMQRHCTLTTKIEPLRSKAKQLAGRGNPVTMWLGISTDEPSRIKPCPDKRITHRWPLIELDMSRSDCLGWMTANGYKTPPRSACVYCPFHNDSEWLRIRNENPSEFQGVVELELRLQESTRKCTRLHGVPFFHSSRVPLSEVQFSGDTTNHMNNECEGACGL